MKPALLLLLAAVPAFLVLRTSLFDPRRAEVEAAFERADVVLRAQAEHRNHLALPDFEFARLFPVGWWRLLVEAHPDVAFERYAGGLDGAFPDRLVAAWGIHALAQLRHPRVKTLLIGRTRSEIPEIRAHAIRVLRFYMDPALTPRLVRMLPPEIREFDDNDLTWAILQTATWSKPPDPDAVRRAIERHEKRMEAFAGTDSGRLCLEVLTADDPIRTAERLLREDPESAVRDDFEEWVPFHAAHRRLADWAPLLRLRVDLEIRVQKEDENEKFLDPAGSGEPLDPMHDAFWGFRGAFVLAAYRKALRDLGVPLSDEERRWLDAHRLLRPPLDYLVEAGILSRR